MAKQNKTKWDALSMKDRASFIKIGIQNGITDLEEIKQYYNILDSNTYDNGGLLNRVKGKLSDLYHKITSRDIEESPYVTQEKIFEEPIQEIDLEEIKRRQAWTESAGNDKAISHRGAMGRFQIMPATHEEYIAKTGNKGDLLDPIHNEEVRDWHMDRLQQSRTIYNNNPTDSVYWGKVLAGYNYGLGNLGRTLEKAKNEGVDIYKTFDWLPYLPKETRDYVNFILRNQDTGAHRTQKLYEKRNTSYKYGGKIKNNS